MWREQHGDVACSAHKRMYRWRRKSLLTRPKYWNYVLVSVQEKQFLMWLSFLWLINVKKVVSLAPRFKNTKDLTTCDSWYL